MKAFSKSICLAIIVSFCLCYCGCTEPKPKPRADSGESDTTVASGNSTSEVSLESIGLTSKGWFQSYNQALAKSKETGKPILMEFTGSDWCPPCQMLADRIFSTDEFKQWAKEHVVLLELDFPRKNPSFPAALMNQNQELAQKHKVSGFPTLIFLDSSENKIGQTSGYNGKDVEDYLKMFEEMIGS